mgnify:FL=1
MKFFKKILILFFINLLLLSNTIYVFGAINDSNEPNLISRAAILIDNKSDKILYSKNMNEKMFPASTTKIVTAIIVLEHCSLNETVTASYDAISSIPNGYVTANIYGGEELTVEELLELLLVHSANDAANVLAEYVGGSIDSFVSMMNTKVNELGLNNTHFTNTYGLQNENHYTSAYDLSIIMKYCLKNDTFRKIAGSASCSIPATNKSEARSYSSTNELIIPDNSNYYSFVTVGKTGFTTEAGECLVSCAYKNNMELICVVLGGSTVNNISTRFSESKTLYEYGFNNFSIKNISNTGDIITEVDVNNATYDTKSLNLAFSSSINVLVNNSDKNTNYTPEIKLNSDISAPITQGDILGKAIYSIDGIQYESDLVATHNVEKSNLYQFILEIGGLFIALLITLKIFFPKEKTENQSMES